MADGHVAGAGSVAREAVERLLAASTEIRSAALFDERGELLVASAPGEWGERAAELWEAAAAVEEEPERVHVATEAGEAFAVRSPSGASAVAVAQRFALASLVFCDLRAALRDLDAAAADGAGKR